VTLGSGISDIGTLVAVVVVDVRTSTVVSDVLVTVLSVLFGDGSGIYVRRQ
jgi:hypothetical protein